MNKGLSLIYDRCCYLLKTYRGTRKTFYLGHWEGDWEIRGRASSREDPTPERIANKIRWLIKTALQWGCPFVLCWEMYNNEVYKDGKRRGF